MKTVGSLTKRLGKQLQDFVQRDDASCLTSGIKQTITRKKIKKQKRILNSSLQELHERFLKENEDIKISYTSFCRRKPFWVVAATELDRETCACKLHENMKFLASALKKKGLIQTDTLSELTKMASCDKKKIECMYGNCDSCKDINLVDGNAKFDQNEVTEWFQWKTKKEKRIVRSEEKEVVITVKELEQDTVWSLIDKFHEQLARYKKHEFNITNQLRHYRHLKENLAMNEIMIHIDFAENYECKLEKEIQSMHFGASKKQITLHTGVYYTAKDQQAQSFCTVSDSLEHGPNAIWAQF